MDQSPIEVHAHPPERRRRQTVTLPCGCCCCCCCCLHTVGGLIGAAIGGNLAARAAKPLPPPDFLGEGGVPGEVTLPPPPRSTALSPEALYWIILAALANLTFLISCLGITGDPFQWVNRGAMEGVGGALLILAIFLPAVQLVASLIAMVVAGLTDRRNAAARIWAVAKITFGTLIGTGAGIGIMALICIPMMR